MKYWKLPAVLLLAAALATCGEPSSRMGQVRIVNGSGAAIVDIFITHHGDDWLFDHMAAGEEIAPGQARSFEIIQAGAYDIRAVDADGLSADALDRSVVENQVLDLEYRVDAGTPFLE
jgi:hypothetical protein